MALSRLRRERDPSCGSCLYLYNQTEAKINKETKKMVGAIRSDVPRADPGELEESSQDKPLERRKEWTAVEGNRVPTNEPGSAMGRF